MQNYDKLKSIIQKTNPEIMGDWSGCNVCNTMCNICDDRFYKEKSPRPIRLADVLLAVKKKEAEHERALRDKMPEIEPVKYPLFYQVMMAITNYELNGKSFWDYTNDNLDAQSDETKTFLINLLVKKN